MVLIKSKFRVWLRKSKFAGLLFLVMCLCLFSQVALSQEESSFELYARRSTIWQSNNIPVCWENPSNNFTNEMRWVQEAAVNSWQRVSAVNFTGWSTCNSGSGGIRIQIADIGPYVQKLGSDLNGIPNGMVLNFTFRNWGQDCQSGRERCIRLISIHEFGHALGFAHEQNRPDTPVNQPGSTQQWCTQERQGPDGDLIIGAWDLNSVMNYCNPRWTGDGILSQTDIQGLQQLYGDRQQNRLYIRSFDGRTFGSVISTQVVSNSNGFRGWSWNGTTASYIAVSNGQSTLYIRPFDGRTFGSVTSSQMLSNSDVYRGWSWNGTTASYVAVSNGQSTLYIRPFDGRTFGSVTSSQAVSSTDRLGDWSWNGAIASYVAKYP